MSNNNKITATTTENIFFFLNTMSFYSTPKAYNIYGYMMSLITYMGNIYF